MKKRFFVIAHNIRSAYNVGSFFRTADALGVDRLILSGYTPTPDNHIKIAKTALGAERFVEWEQASQVGRVISRLKKDGFEVVALERRKNSINLTEYRPVGQSVALILGNEIEGISKHVLLKSDQVVAIPMLGRKESLNVAVAFGIAGFFITNRC
ncbi:MAG TPA: RNA methyltransferase [Candidatus Moranbacteria bacterium]|nr:RNA methyltransferase [Candidatus Moranbacteria bacterium]